MNESNLEDELRTELNEEVATLIELENSAIVTPFNLLENIKLDDYESIYYHKEDDLIVANIKFKHMNSIIEFIYYFKGNKLQKIIDTDNNVVTFDRDALICKQKKILQDIKNKYTKEGV